MTQSDPEFNKLYNTYKNRVYGFIRSQVDEDADAEDIAQETWAVLWKMWPIYDPTRSFLPFARYWASIVLLRYYHAKGKRRKVEELFSDLLKWFPELEREEDIQDIITSISEPDGDHTEDALWLAESYDALLRIACNGPNPLHHLIVFFFCKFLSWTPREVVSQFDAIPLRELVKILTMELAQHLPLPADRIHFHFAPLRQCLDRPVREVIEDEKTRQTHSTLLDRRVGETTLAEYFTNSAEPTANISHWWYSVRRRLVKAVKEQGSGPFMT